MAKSKKAKEEQVTTNQETPEKNKVKSSYFRIGAKTFFFDVNLASNNNRYLKVTESRYMGEGAESIRNSVVIFPEQIEDFQRSLKEMVVYLV